MEAVEYDRAAVAVAEFRRMLPMLTGFVRAVARKQVKVEISTQTCTDGDTVYLRPPMALAESRIHNRLVCDLRGADHALLCPACAAREDIYSDIYHEAAHILHGSFDEVARDDVEAVLAAGASYGSPEYQERVQRAADMIEECVPGVVAQDIHPYVHAMLLAVEDVRVDAAAGTARPGVEVMRRNSFEVILNRGVEQDDGTWMRWLEQEPESQVSIAVMAQMQGHVLDERFADQVIEAVRHEEVDELLREPPLGTVLDALGLAVALVGVLERLGVFTLDDDGTGGDRQFAGMFPGNGDAGDAVTAILAATGHSHDEEPEIDEDTLGTAIEQTKTFDEYSPGTGRQVIYRGGTGPAYSPYPPRFRPRKCSKHVPAPDGILGQPVMRARRLFSASRVDGVDTGLRSGKLDTALLGRRAAFGDDRVFRRRQRAEGIDWEVVIGLDVSGSTDEKDAIALIRQLGEAMANVLHRVGVKFSVYGHSTSYAGIPEQHLYEIKTVDHPWGPDQKALLAGILPAYGSLDGHNVEFYRKILDRSKCQRRMLIYFTDGEIPATNPEEQEKIMRREVDTCDKRGYSVLGVGIGSDSPTKFGLDTVRVDSVSDIVTMLRELEKRITRN